MKKLLMVLVALVVVFACSSAWAGWGYCGPGPYAVYRPWGPVVSYYSPAIPVVPAPVVTEAPIVTESVVAPPVVYPAPVVVGPRFYYRPIVRPVVRVWW
jgi:hypothetical protein